METSLDINPFLQIDPVRSNSISTLNSLAGQKKITNDDASLRKIAQDFEAVLLNFVVKAMWKTIPKGGLFDGGGSMQGYTEIMQNALAEDLAAKGGFGVAPVIYNQLKPKSVVTEAFGKSAPPSPENGVKKGNSEDVGINKEMPSVNFKG
ncbi:MAG: hypothetical protein A2W17_08610 [Planctomycetes bacterium RBG_16_41_13]|nr:MAG: hypothetical protein A2W17_08610 [Planctomycetes bacterium RBG_16_41_13]